MQSIKLIRRHKFAYSKLDKKSLQDFLYHSDIASLPKANLERSISSLSANLARNPCGILAVVLYLYYHDNRHHKFAYSKLDKKSLRDFLYHDDIISLSSANLERSTSSLIANLARNPCGILAVVLYLYCHDDIGV